MVRACVHVRVRVCSQRVRMFAGLPTGFANMVLGQIVLMLKVELPLGVLPCDWCTSTSEAHLDSPAARVLHRMHVPPVAFRLVFRSLYLGSLLLAAEALIGAGLATYVNIAGALGLAAMTYWMPFLLWICRAVQLRREARERDTRTSRGVERVSAASAASVMHEGSGKGAFWATSYQLTGIGFACRASLYSALALGGLFISGTGMYFNAEALATTKFNLFHPDSCKEGAHFWGNQMWDPKLPPNASAYVQLVIGCCANGTSCGS